MPTSDQVPPESTDALGTVIEIGSTVPARDASRLAYEFEPLEFDATSVVALSHSRGASDAEEVLTILRHIRQLIVSDMDRGPLPETFFCPLSCEFPIKAMSRQGFHGFVDMRVEGYQDDEDGVRRAVAFTVRSMALQLQDEQGSRLPVELILATFIHELAHTVTRPEKRRCTDVSNDVLKLQPHKTMPENGFVEVHHSGSFYANFAALLRVAERLGVFALPSSPNKFAPKSLMRFDNVDLEASLSGLNVGRSALFGAAFGAQAKPLVVLLTDNRRSKQKPLTLETRSLAKVLQQGKQRLNLRTRPTLVTDASGQKVDEDRLQTLEDGTLLIVS